jgi:hypothetical protein
MTVLTLKPYGRRREDYYDVIADVAVIGRIILFTTTPTGLLWVWTMAPRHEEGTQTHGYETSKEAAPQAFARSWRRDAEVS